MKLKPGQLIPLVVTTEDGDGTLTPTCTLLAPSGQKIIELALTHEQGGTYKPTQYPTMPADHDFVIAVYEFAQAFVKDGDGVMVPKYGLAQDIFYLDRVDEQQKARDNERNAYLIGRVISTKQIDGFLIGRVQ